MLPVNIWSAKQLTIWLESESLFSKVYQSSLARLTCAVKSANIIVVCFENKEKQPELGLVTKACRKELKPVPYLDCCHVHKIQNEERKCKTKET